jgi:hypothetical protein
MTDLTQAEADGLLNMLKRRVTDDTIEFPAKAERISVELESHDKSEKFWLDVNRGSIAVSKITYQNRARVVYILARLDLGGAPHRNPDGTEIPCPHLHLYREGFADKWAVPVPQNFTKTDDLWTTFQEFLQFCNITEPSNFQRTLFT